MSETGTTTAPDRFAVTVVEPAELRLWGEFDADGYDRFHGALDDLLAHEPARLVIDLSDVSFMATSGVSALLRAQSRHPDVVLRGVQRPVMRVFEVSGLREYITFED